MKCLEEDIGVNFHDLGFDNGFLVMISKEQTLKQKQMHWTSSKYQAFVLQGNNKKSEKNHGQSITGSLAEQNSYNQGHTGEATLSLGGGAEEWNGLVPYPPAAVRHQERKLSWGGPP